MENENAYEETKQEADVVEQPVEKLKTSQLKMPSRKLIGAIIGVLILIALFSAGFFVGQSTSKPPASDKRAAAPAIIATQKIDKSFLFPVKNDKGDVLTKVKYLVDDANLEDVIIIKGERATSIKGKTFLVINIKITNSFNQGMNINAKDYIRLSVNNSAEMLAPDIHNDPVAVQAKSTKLTRVAFPVNDTDKDLTLYVGEINGNKEPIKLTLSRK